MNFSFPTPPDAVSEAMGQTHTVSGVAAFESVQKMSAQLSQKLGGMAPLAAAVNAHEQFTIPLDKLAGGSPLAAAIATGWRTLDVSADGVIASRLLALDAKKMKAEVASLNVGPFGTATAEAISGIQAHKAEGSYEFRFLLLPQIYLASIWLASAERNYFAPLAPCPPAFDPKTVYDEKQFFALVKPLAEQALGFDSSPQK